MSRKYKAPAGGTSITIGGETYAANKKGIVEVPDSADHADLLAHGFTLVGDASAVEALDPEAQIAALAAQVASA